MTSPENNYRQDCRSSHNNKPPIYSADNFLPLGFSSPINKIGQVQDSRYISTFKKQHNNYKRSQQNYKQHHSPNDNYRYQNTGKKFYNNRREDNISTYFHISMLQDPWQKLLPNHNINDEKNSTNNTSKDSQSECSTQQSFNEEEKKVDEKSACLEEDDCEEENT